MTDATRRHLDRAAVLRAEFDSSFASPYRAGEADGEGFLEIRIGQGTFALRLSEVAGLFSNKKITPIPSAVPAFLGVASFRGLITPVYSLETFFDKTITTHARWLVIAATAPVALAFAELNGQSQRLPEDILPSAPDQQAQRFVRDFLPLDGRPSPIVDLEAVVAEIRMLSAKSKP